MIYIVQGNNDLDLHGTYVNIVVVYYRQNITSYNIYIIMMQNLTLLRRENEIFEHTYFSYDMVTMLDAEQTIKYYPSNKKKKINNNNN